MLCSESLVQIKPFDKLPNERINWICDRAEPIYLSSGEVLVSQGDTSLGFFIQVGGKITVTQRTNGIDMPVGHHESPSFFGEIQVLTEDIVPVTLTADTNTELYRLNCPDFLELVHSCREFERDIFRTVSQRLRGLESSIRTREKMAALGTLSAGLAHELNNPAAALVRVMKDIKPAMLELQRMNLVYGQQQPDEAHTQQWTDARDRGFAAIANPDNNPLAQSDREDTLTDWLEDYGVQDAWKLAEPLAAGRVEPKTLDTLISCWRNNTTEMRDIGIRWLALSFDVMSMIHNGFDGAQRISELVTSMKSYSYMDQAAQQQVDIHEGLENTLRLLAFKLKKGINVERKYDRDMPKIMAYGSELNQVWTNLLDNAIDALGEGVPSGKPPQITIQTCQNKNSLIVEIKDNGPGILPEIKNRILEPFFTTKPMGKGSGLGLDVVRRIVQNQHQGALLVESSPGKTCFSVHLPLTPKE